MEHLLDSKNPNIIWWLEYLTTCGFVLIRTDNGINFSVPNYSDQGFHVQTFQELDSAYHAIIGYQNLRASLISI